MYSFHLDQRVHDRREAFSVDAATWRVGRPRRIESVARAVESVVEAQPTSAGARRRHCASGESWPSFST